MAAHSDAPSLSEQANRSPCVLVARARGKCFGMAKGFPAPLSLPHLRPGGTGAGWRKLLGQEFVEVCRDLPPRWLPRSRPAVLGVGFASRDDYVLWWCEVRSKLVSRPLPISIEAHNRVRADLSQPQRRSVECRG